MLKKVRLPEDILNGSLFIRYLFFIAALCMAVLFANCSKTDDNEAKYNGKYYCYDAPDSLNSYKMLILDNLQYSFQKIENSSVVAGDDGSLIFSDTILTITLKRMFNPQFNEWRTLTSPFTYSYSVHYNIDTLVIFPFDYYDNIKTGTYIRK